MLSLSNETSMVAAQQLFMLKGQNNLLIYIQLYKNIYTRFFIEVFEIIAINIHHHYNDDECFRPILFG